MHRLRRFLLLAGIVVLMIAFALGGAGVYLIRRALPQTNGTLAFTGLQDAVEVLRDHWGVPHIFARNAHDLFLAQGYVHAQDRLWQMELNRRTASGRLAEFAGEPALATDRLFRTLGLRRAAEAEFAHLDPETKEALELYAAGVNEFVAQHGSALPLEFTLLRLTPDPWSPIDTLAFGKLMAWVLGGNWSSELMRAHLVARFGVEGMRFLMPPYSDSAPIIVPREASYHTWNTAALFRLLDAGQGISEVGSNNWVVSGTRTTTGSPILANDPHLEAQMPSIWYEMHLVGGPYNVAGSTFPGTPGVVIGHNADIAWGVTNGGPDVQDLYMEQFDPADPTRYRYRDAWEPATLVREEIKVKGRAAPVVETVRITRHGPILNSVVDGLGAFLALRWTALEPGSLSTSIMRLNRAHTWSEFRAALRLWTVPAQNFVFADRQGNIGYQLPGRIPIRAKGIGLLPVPGWTGEYEWIGEIPFEQLPSVLNPRRGYIATANNRIVPDGYPYFISADWDPGFRARRIETMLADSPHASLGQMARIQLDLTSLPAQAFVRALSRIPLTNEPAAGLLAQLRAELESWDGVLRPNSRPAAIYEAVRLSLVPLVFKDVLGPELYTRYLGHVSSWQTVLLRLLETPTSPWWGPAGRDAVVTRAFTEAYDLLNARLGPDRSGWTWGRLHTMQFVHPVGRMPAVAWIFNVSAPPTSGGDATTVNNGGFDLATFRQRTVASYRQLLDLADWDRSLSIHTTGQSGVPFSPHYHDFVLLWAAGRYHPMLFSRDRIEDALDGKLTLTPP